MIIGIVGLIGSGKSSVGDILCENYGFGKDSFAKPLKDAASSIFNWNRTLLEGHTDESRQWREDIDPYWSKALGDPSFTPRKALQMLGTESARNVFGENIWSSSLINRVTNPTGVIKDFVITDVRFPNEIQAIRNIGGYVALVSRGEKPEWYKLAEYQNLVKVYIPESMHDQYPDVHYSEWAWIGQDFDFEIDNNGDLADLEKSVSKMFESFIRKSLDKTLVT